jgi:glycosyltransferase involved in cell wall biosynthesis
MKTLAFVFCFNRAETLVRCVRSIFEHSERAPDEVVLIDDGSTDRNVIYVLLEVVKRYRDQAKITLWLKAKNEGFSDSAVRAMAYARQVNPDFLYFIEGDYVFRKNALDLIADCLTNTPQGARAMGIVGYDHPNFYSKQMLRDFFPNCMIAQLGEDNVNRAALHRPAPVNGARFRFEVELVSNTCFSSYLNWKNIQIVAREFPELNDLLDQACCPKENPNYPSSGRFKDLRCVDDGMLSHAISLCWNRWALKHGVDRERFGAWINIKPSVAQHVFEGGMHA